jgi:crossover junction endodeoxyribonuclease RuvC
MTVLGIDPGLERVGYGLIRREGSKLIALDYGLITTPRILLHDRLRLLHEQMTSLVDRIQPDALATEKLLFSVNVKTAMDVSKALGVLLLVGSQRGLSWSEYTPPEIKLAVVGNGAAEKKQVQYMVTKLLGLKETPKPDDVADALAIAICHGMRCRKLV